MQRLVEFSIDPIRGKEYQEELEEVRGEIAGQGEEK
jgi:hypothetical protein